MRRESPARPRALSLVHNKQRAHTTSPRPQHADVLRQLGLVVNFHWQCRAKRTRRGCGAGCRIDTKTAAGSKAARRRLLSLDLHVQWGVPRGYPLSRAESRRALARSPLRPFLVAPLVEWRCSAVGGWQCGSPARRSSAHSSARLPSPGRGAKSGRQQQCSNVSSFEKPRMRDACEWGTKLRAVSLSVHPSPAPTRPLARAHTQRALTCFCSPTTSTYCASSASWSAFTGSAEPSGLDAGAVRVDAPPRQQRN